MQKSVPPIARQGKLGRWRAILLTVGLLISIGESTALAERLDLSVQPWRAATFDASVLEPPPADLNPADPPAPDGNETGGTGWGRGRAGSGCG
jgi:hypothetical protein